MQSNNKIKKIFLTLVSTLVIMAMGVACSSNTGRDTGTADNGNVTENSDSKNNITDTKPDSDNTTNNNTTGSTTDGNDNTMDKVGDDLKEGMNDTMDDIKDTADDIMGKDNNKK